MKKSLFIVLISALTLQGFAQTIQLGLRFNPNVSWFSIQNKGNTLYIQNDGANLSLSYGLMADIYFAENYAVATGIQHLIFKGKTFPLESSITYTKWKIQYLQIPINLKMRTNDINGIMIYGKFGITPMVRLNSVIDNKVPSNLGLFNSTLNIGGGIHYLIGGNTTAMAGLTFNNGFVKINKDAEYSIKTSGLSLDLGLLF